MSTTTSRRAVLAGATALATGAAANAVAIVATRAAEKIGLENSPIVDPIFAVIERHREAFLKFSASGGRQGELGSGPEHDEQERLTWKVYYADVTVIAREIVETIPTTIAGMIALLNYALNFNDGALCHERMPDHPLREWSSSAWMWPDEEGDEDEEVEEGTPFAWLLLCNIITTLGGGRA